MSPATTLCSCVLLLLLGGCSSEPIEESPPTSQSSTASTSSTSSAPAEQCLSYTTCSAIDQAIEGPPAVLLGTGEKCYLPLAPSQTVPIVGGPQGGFHIWVALRSTGLGDEVLAKMRVLDKADDGAITLVDPIERMVELCAVGEGWHEAARLFAQLDAYTPEEVEPFVGRTIKLGLSLKNPAAASASAEVTLMLGSVIQWTDNELDD